jgi:RimJ/RimL family protein N-acetyltransferase
MKTMPDMAAALRSFQSEYRRGGLRLQAGILDQNLWLCKDNPTGQNARMTYVKLSGKTVTALVAFTWVEPIDGIPCAQIGYAVPEKLRKQGRAKEAVNAALADLQHGLRERAGILAFFVEAIVAADNEPSLRVAEQTISVSSTAVEAQVPALRFLRKMETP